QSRNRQSYTETVSGPLFEGTIVFPLIHSEDNSFTYLVTPQFKISPHLMTYGRFASGYRPGGPNPGPSSGTPRSYKFDSTVGYELCAKGDLLDDRLSFDVSGYYIDWKDIQLQISDLSGPVSGNYFANAGKAKSQGIELSVEARPMSGLTIAGWVSWNDATL